MLCLSQENCQIIVLIVLSHLRPIINGLRDYGTEPVIFGGNKDCDHKWDSYIRPKNTWGEPNKNVGGIFKNSESNTSWVKEKEMAFCSKCGAWKGQLGLEPDPNMFIDNLIEIFLELKRALKKGGAIFVNLGDTYSQAGGNKEINSGNLKNRNDEFKKNGGHRIEWLPPKCLCNIPSRFAIAMTDRLGLSLRNEIIWHKPNCMPVSVKDRFTVDFEKIYFFTKNRKYFFKQQFESMSDVSIKRANYDSNSEKSEKYAGLSSDNIKAFSKKIQNGEKTERNMRATWSITTKSFKEAHFATYPEDLVQRILTSVCPENGIVLDPFFGSGTTGIVAKKMGLHFVWFELNQEYINIAKNRLHSEYGLFLGGSSD